LGRPENSLPLLVSQAGYGPGKKSCKILQNSSSAEENESASLLFTLTFLSVIVVVIIKRKIATTQLHDLMKSKKWTKWKQN